MFGAHLLKILQNGELSSQLKTAQNKIKLKNTILKPIYVSKPGASDDPVSKFGIVP